MQALYGTDVHEASYRMPAPWGSLVLTTAFDTLWEIQADFTPVTQPDVAPEYVATWMQRIEEQLIAPSPLSQEALEALLTSPRLQNASTFAKKVLAAVTTVAAGEFVTYGSLASRVGRPDAARAVGRILAANPFIVLIPCHRVMTAQMHANMDLTQPLTLQPSAYCGQPELAPVATWLRINDLALAG